MKKIFTLIALHFVLLTFAQPGSLDTSFNPTDTGFGEAPDGIIRTTLLQPDGKIIITGDFTQYGGSEAYGMARLDSSGKLDPDFHYSVCSVTCHFVYTTSLQSDGKIIIGGAFSGTSRNRIARLNSNGVIDTSFNLGTGFNNTVFYTVIQSDGKIIVAGDFTSYNGTAIYKLARLNTDGTLDPSFNPGTSANNSITTISIQLNGKIIVAGDFTSFNGSTCSRIVRLNSDGSVDALFNNSGANDTISSTSIQSNGQIIIGGSFTSYAGTTRNRIARLNPDGTLDSSFIPGTGANNNVSGVLNQSDGKIIITGTFTSYAGVARNGIARLNSNGSLDTTFSTGTVATDIISMASLQTDGKIVVAGTLNGGKSHIIRLNTTGTTDNNFNQAGKGANDAVLTSVVLSSGKILIAGDFTVYNDVARNRIARLNADGTLDASFNPGTGADDAISAIAVQKDGKIIIGGGFGKYNGVERDYLARLNADGSLDTTFNSGLGPSDPVNTISIQSDGKVIIGGEFSTVGLTIINHIARLDTLGKLDTSFNIGIDPDMLVGVSLIQPNGKIIIGGYLINYYGAPKKILARLNADGSLDGSFYNMNFADMITDAISDKSYVATLALQSDGKIIVGGQIYDAKTDTWDGLYRLNPDGSFDSGFNTGTSMKGHVNTVSLQSDGKIIVGGWFTNIGGNRIVRLNANGSLDTGFNSGTGPDNEVYTMSLQPDGKIIIGGTFKSYNGTGRNRVARINGGSSLGISDNEFAQSIQLYPNPVSDILTINTQEDIAPEVEIYDILGKSLKTLTSFDKRIDVSSLPSGVYIINVTDGQNGVYRSKFVKK